MHTCCRRIVIQLKVRTTLLNSRLRMLVCVYVNDIVIQSSDLVCFCFSHISYEMFVNFHMFCTLVYLCTVCFSLSSIVKHFEFLN